MTMLNQASVEAALRNMLLKGLGGDQYKDVPSGTPTTSYAHGPSGLFSLPGVDPMVFSAIVGMQGLISRLPAYGSLYTNPLFTVVTGVRGDVGSEKNNTCDDPPVAGLVKAGTLTAQFGRYERMTREFDINRLGQLVNRGEPADLRLVNVPITPGGIFDMPAPGNARDAVRSEIGKAFFELQVAFMRLLGKQLWTGNPVNNSAGGGYREMPGLEIQIGTGKVDAESNVALPSLDSDVKNFNYLNVDGSDGGDIVESLTYLYRYLRKNASTMGLDPVTWVIAMREEAFYEISAIWPCSYLTYQCSFNDREDQARLNVDAGDQIAMRDSMRQGRYLLIDSQRIEVIFDDGIVEESHTNNGAIRNTCFASDVYFIPLTVMGGTPVTYIEYFIQGNAMTQEALDMMYNNFYRITGNGAYIVHAKPPNNWCIQWLAKIEPRVIMRTPFLAGRLNNVEYCPLQHTRQPLPTDPYFVNGGNIDRAAFPPSFYNEW